MRTRRFGEFSSDQTWWLKLIGAICVSVAAFITNAQPANDNFADRIVAAANATIISGTLSNATAEVGEPSFPGISSGQTAWWTWIAPSNGILDLSIHGSGFNPFVTIQSGETLDALSLVASNNYLACYESTACGCHWRTRNQMSVHVAQGQAYQFSVDSALFTDSFWARQLPTLDSLFYGSQVVQTTNVIPGGDFSLNLHFTPAPKNDDFANRQLLSGSRVHTSASNKGATMESGEPHSPTNVGGSSVWYSWTAPASGRVTISTNNIPPYAPPGWTYYGVDQSFHNLMPICGNEIDQTPPPTFFPIFGAYTGTTVDSLISDNAFPLSLDAYPHAMGFDVVKGETYQIAFDGNQGTTGDIPLYLALTKPASNDDFKKRIATRGIYVVGTGFNAGATRESGEPLSATNTFGKSVWWSWTAPVSGNVSINLNGSEYAFPATVFAGGALSNLLPLASGTGSIQFEATAGQTYQIAVTDLNGITGGITFHLQAPVVEAQLISTNRSRQKVLLSYQALNGQKLLLQKSTDGSQWTDIRTCVAHGNGASFGVNETGMTTTPLYRAIIVDWLR
jgi:hypothetical protein